MKAYQAVLTTPFGAIGVLMQGDLLAEIDLLTGRWEPKAANDAAASGVVSLLQAYLQDPATRLAPPVTPQGTDFQQRVWQRLTQIPAGKTVTYGEIARELKSSARAVGNACRANPRPLVVPCHRVVSAAGVGGFAGQREGEMLAVKHWLLAHEGGL